MWIYTFCRKLRLYIHCFFSFSEVYIASPNTYFQLSALTSITTVKNLQIPHGKIPLTAVHQINQYTRYIHHKFPAITNVYFKMRLHQIRTAYSAATLLSIVEYYELSDDGPLRPKQVFRKLSHT